MVGWASRHTVATTTIAADNTASIVHMPTGQRAGIETQSSSAGIAVVVVVAPLSAAFAVASATAAAAAASMLWTEQPSARWGQQR